ncbi:hypothetical protein MSPP1_000724 [Malassezia sp. CBS 17886]|nr:hypothetical protein MSPP1_000724 [Malassezia sp. CBS 17886]
MSVAPLSHAERTYIVDGLTQSPPQRQDGRGLADYRPLEVQEPMTRAASGSACAVIGTTEVMCGVKAEVESCAQPSVPIVQGERSVSYMPWLPATPRVQAAVEYSPALLHEHSPAELGMITTTVQEMLAACFARQGDAYGPFPARQFVVVPHAKYWLLHVDVYVLSWSGGNVLDTLFAAVFAALWGTRLPRTKLLAMDTRAGADTAGVVGADNDPAGMKFITRGRRTAAAKSTATMDFALLDDADGGAHLHGREGLPVCVSVYPLGDTFLLDPTLEEESSLRTCISVLAARDGRLYGVRQRGDGVATLATVNKAVETGVYYAGYLCDALQTKRRA